jgi:hypothetical protein
VALAYEFNCELSLEEMLGVLNKKGAWKWTMRDSYWYGDYLICRPEEDVRVRIHQPAEFYAGITRDPKDLEPRDYYTAVFTIEFKIDTTCRLRRWLRAKHEVRNTGKVRFSNEYLHANHAACDAVDHTFRELLVHLQARNVRAIASYT